MYPQCSLNCSADHVKSSVRRNTWSRIARIFGGTVSRVGNGPGSGDWPGSGDCDISNDFRSAMPPACDTCAKVACAKVACDQVACDHRSSSLH